MFRIYYKGYKDIKLHISMIQAWKKGHIYERMDEIKTLVMVNIKE